MIYIVGPTSSGKTSLALKVCKKFNKEIISADSRQIYKHFDVGTGKLPVSLNGGLIERSSRLWEIDGVKIHMYDVCDANVNYSVSDFLNDTKNLVGEDKIVVGGTGLYIDNLLGLKKPSPVPPNMKLRNSLEEKTVSELQAMLPKEVLNSMNQSDINNPRRLIRKIEIEQSPKSQVKLALPQDKNPQIIILDLSREELFRRVDLWVDLIWEDLLVEVDDLVNLEYENSFPMNGIIYKTVMDFKREKFDEPEAIQVIKNDLHAYIRRQQTWFKTYNQNYAKRFNSLDNAFSYIESILAK